MKLAGRRDYFDRLLVLGDHRNRRRNVLVLTEEDVQQELVELSIEKLRRDMQRGDLSAGSPERS